MSNEWPTQQQDMEAAEGIIDKYKQLHEDAPLGFLDIVVHKSEKDRIELKMPEWIIDLRNYFRHLYGYEHGHAVTSKVLTKFLLQNETLH